MNIRRTRRVSSYYHTYTKILESLHVDYTHVLVDGKIVTTGGAELVEEINNNGFDRFVKGE